MPSVRSDGTVVTQKVNHHQDQQQAAVTNLGRLLRLQWMGAPLFHGMATPKPKGALIFSCHASSFLHGCATACTYISSESCIFSTAVLNYFNHLSPLC
jgi:hypothetical protein